MGTSGLVETAPKKIGESYSWLVNDYLWLMVDDYLWLMVRKYLSAWWGPYLTYPSEIHDGVSNSWDDDMPNMM